MKKSKKVIIIGAGISGLTTAYLLHKEGFDVTVLEKNDEVGGSIETRTEKGFLFDRGPNSAMETTPIISQLVEELNLKEGLSVQEAGAFVCFEGLVRNHNQGKKVIALEYEASEQLCQKEYQKIFKEAEAEFNVIKIKCFHRVGKLNIKEMAVWIGVIADHRDHAFKACRFIIDELKSRLPIWKKEYYEDGDSQWVHCG